MYILHQQDNASINTNLNKSHTHTVCPRRPDLIYTFYMKVVKTSWIDFTYTAYLSPIESLNLTPSCIFNNFLTQTNNIIITILF